MAERLWILKPVPQNVGCSPINYSEKAAGVFRRLQFRPAVLKKQRGSAGFSASGPTGQAGTQILMVFYRAANPKTDQRFISILWKVPDA
jgi:hypothetical protein